MIAGLDDVLSVAAAAAPDVDRSARFPREAITALGDAGLLGLTIPEHLGGLGRGPAEFAEATTALATACASSAMVLTMHVCAVELLRAAGDGRFDAVLREAAAGRHLSTLALSERATRSNFWISMGASEEVPGGRRLAVEKSFVTSAGRADGYVVSVATPGRQSDDALDLFYVEAGSGVEILDWWQGAGLRGNASAPVRFTAEVDGACAIGAGGAGQPLLLQIVIPLFQLGAACTSLGVARAAAEATRAHVSSQVLEHLGETLGDQPVVRHGLGTLQTDVDVLEGFVRQVAAELADGTAPIHHVLEVKVAANEVALRATDLAMRLCGGVAYSGRHPLDRHFRDARAGVVMAPTADLLYDMIGRVLLGRPPL